MKVQTAERINQVSEYYFSAKLSQIREMQSSGKDIINLGIGNPDMEPSSKVTESASKMVNLKTSHGYQPYNSIIDLRKSFSNWYKKLFSVSLNPENEILPLMGSKEGIMHLSLAFLNRADGVLVPDPGYPAYEAAAKICGARVIHYNLLEKNSWYPDLDDLGRRDLDGVKIMWVNYPNMPTGKVASDSLLRSLIEFGKEHGILIVNDNPYSLILNPEPRSLLSFDPGKEFSMELNSLSKSHNMAGWRVGMIAGSRENIESILKVKSNIDSGMFLPVQVAAIEALKLGDDWFADLNKTYMQRRDIVYSILDRLGSSYAKDQSGLFIWSSLPGKHTSSFDFSDWLLEEYEVFITPGSIFGSNGRSYLRTSLCVSEERLMECLRRIEEKIKNQQV